MKKVKHIKRNDFDAEQFMEMNICPLKESPIKMKLNPIFMMKERRQKKIPSLAYSIVLRLSYFVYKSHERYFLQGILEKCKYKLEYRETIKLITKASIFLKMDLKVNIKISNIFFAFAYFVIATVFFYQKGTSLAFLFFSFNENLL